MHNLVDCYRHLWLLSGTGEGPALASALTNDGWKVTVSVVSHKALVGYEGIALHEILSGSLEGIKGIKGFLEDSKVKHNGFKVVVDATHPFASTITKNLKKACTDFDQRLIRFERKINDLEEATLINSFQEIEDEPLLGKNLLFAIGFRSLREAVISGRRSGANIFARIPPSVKAIQCASSIGLNEDQIALVNPLQGSISGDIENALCNRWFIDAVVCRQSGGVIENLWQEISKSRSMRLFLLARPSKLCDLEVVYSLQELKAKIKSAYL